MHVQKVITLSSHTNRRNPTPTARRSSSPGTSSASLLVLIQSVAQHLAPFGAHSTAGDHIERLAFSRHDDPINARGPADRDHHLQPRTCCGDIARFTNSLVSQSMVVE